MDFLKHGVYLWPVGFSLDSYKTIISSKDFWFSIRNTLIITISGVLFGVILTMCGAYAISHKRLVGRKFFIGFMIFTMYFSGGLIPFYILILKLGFYNKLVSLIIPSLVNAFYIIIARSFIDTLPYELHESAYIDGANDLLIFFTIIFPLCKPIIAVLCLYLGVHYWNIYLHGVLFIVDPSLHPIQVYLSRIILKFERVREAGNFSHDRESFYALSIQLKYSLIIMGVLPIMMVYPFIQKYLVKGMMIGSLKG
jgi:putative aldouronate transport system permease protein